MSSTWLDFAIVLGLVAVNAMLSGTEMALVSLRPIRLEVLATESERGRRVAALAQTPSRYLSALQLGITLAGFMASASAAVELSASVAPWFSVLGGSARAASVVAVTVFVSMLTLVFGELVPKRVAMLHAERWSLVAVTPLSWFMRAVGPILRLLELATDGVLRLTGNRSLDQSKPMSNDDLKRLIATQATLEPVQRQILFEAIAMADRTLRHILVPRPRVVSVEINDTADEALKRLRHAGVSRAPLVDRDLDHPIGQVHALDLVESTDPAATWARPLLALPESLSTLRALQRLQASHTKLAVVIDEHGGTAGIVTIEDIVEEFVGEIADDEEWVGTIDVASHDQTMVLPGMFPIHRAAELGLTLPPGPYVTVAGLMLERLGHLPKVGERVQLPHHDLAVSGVGRRSITAVSITSNLVDGEARPDCSLANSS